MSYVGGVMIIAGDLTRKIAIITAAENFDHLVQSKKAADHKVRDFMELFFVFNFYFTFYGIFRGIIIWYS